MAVDDEVVVRGHRVKAGLGGAQRPATGFPDCFPAVRHREARKPPRRLLPAARRAPITDRRGNGAYAVICATSELPDGTLVLRPEAGTDGWVGGLAEALDLIVVDAQAVPLRRVAPNAYLGAGRVEALKAQVEDAKIDVIAANRPLRARAQPGSFFHTSISSTEV